MNETLTSPELTEAENNVIGATLLDESVYNEVDLRPEHFLNPKWAAVWTEIGNAIEAGTPVDGLTIADNIRGVDPNELSKVSVTCGAPALAPSWATIVREHWLSRQLRAVNASLTGEASADLSTVRTRLERLEASTGRKLPTLDHLLVPDYNKPNGLPSGLGIERISPTDIPKGRVTVVFGETGNFKSTVVNNMLWAMVNAGNKVLNVPLEDANELNSMRFLARATGIGYGRLEAGYLLTPEEKKLINAVPQSFKQKCSNVIMGGEIPPDIDEIIRMAAYHKRQHGIDAVIIDYLQCLEPPRHMNRKAEYEFTKYVMRRLQAAAKRENLAIILVNQIDKEASRRLDDPRPREADMLGGSSVRQMSKLTIGVHRPAKYYMQPSEKVSHYTNCYLNAFHNRPDGAHWWKNLLMLYILKNIAGEPGVILHATVDPPTGVITPIVNINEVL